MATSYGFHTLPDGTHRSCYNALSSRAPDKDEMRVIIIGYGTVSVAGTFGTDVAMENLQRHTRYIVRNLGGIV